MPQLPSPPPSATFQQHQCRWSLPPCSETFSDAEALYTHLTNEHIGRKATNNLCLDCHWEDCNVQTTKRDHITSHLRVHVPLKPHVCEICGRAFKRPQDKKKHDKLHEDAALMGQDHAFLDSQLRVPRPMASMRRRSSGRSIVKSERSPSFSPAGSLDGSPRHPTMDTPKHSPFSPYSETTWSDMQGCSPHSGTAGEFSPQSALSPADDVIFGSIPSDQNLLFDHPEFHYNGNFNGDLNGDLNSGIPGGINDVTPMPLNGKRGYDIVDEFMSDFKKKRLSTTYDADMAQRLDEMATFLFDDTTGALPPLDTQPVEHLNDLNTFLLQLSNEIGDSTCYMDNSLSTDDTMSGFHSSFDTYNNVEDSAFVVPANPQPLLNPPIVPTHRPVYNDSVIADSIITPPVVPSHSTLPSSDLYTYQNLPSIPTFDPSTFDPTTTPQDLESILADSPAPTTDPYRFVERQITTMPAMPVLYTLPLQQAAKEHRPDDVCIKVKISPETIVKPRPQRLRPTRSERAEKTEEADVLLRQFRNLSITETIQKEQQAKKPVLEHKSSRKRHADIVRLLLARVSEKLRTVDKGRGHKVGIQRGVKVA